MKKLITITAISYGIVAISILNSCTKPNCFNQQLKDKFATMLCKEDCPGVIGCDGEKYCNECIANSNGIAVK